MNGPRNPAASLRDLTERLSPDGATEDALPAPRTEAVNVTSGDAAVMEELMKAASRTPAALIATAASLIDGSVVVSSPVSGPIYTSPTPVPAPLDRKSVGGGEETAGRGHREATVRQVANTEISLRPGPDVPAHRVDLVGRTVARLLLVRVRRATELQVPEMRLHGAAVRMLLRGETDLAAEITGSPLPAQATVYRLDGGADAVSSLHAVWGAVLPAIVRLRLHTLIARVGDDLALVALHEPDDGDGRTLRLVAHAADTYNLVGGVADPTPVEQLAVAWVEAGQARTGASSDNRLVPAAGLGERALLRMIPADRLAAWAHTLLRPLSENQRKALEAWLRTRSVKQAATALGIDRTTVHVRIAEAEAILGADLSQADARAALQFALRAGDLTPSRKKSSAQLTVKSLLALIPPATFLEWGHGLLGPLTDKHNYSLRVWLRHHGHYAPAAKELRLARQTLTRWINEAAVELRADLGSPSVRAELFAATVATADSAPKVLPRRAGRTYQRIRPPTAEGGDEVDGPCATSQGA